MKRIVMLRTILLFTHIRVVRMEWLQNMGLLSTRRRVLCCGMYWIRRMLNHFNLSLELVLKVILGDVLRLMVKVMLKVVLRQIWTNSLLKMGLSHYRGVVFIFLQRVWCLSMDSMRLVLMLSECLPLLFLIRR